MNEINWLEMDTTVFAVIAAAVMLTVQLVLCFKGNKLWVRLIPVCLCAAAAVVCFVLEFLSDGWDAIGFMFLALFLTALLLVCGIGWGVWTIAQRWYR